MASNFKLDALSDDQVMDAIAKHGGANAAARALGIPKSTFKDRAQAIANERFRTKARVQPDHIGVPAYGVRRVILTSAQDGTTVDTAFLENLKAYAKYLDADIIVAGYTYGAHTKDQGDYHPSIRPFMRDKPIIIGDKIVFCAEINIIPTQTDPLSGFETYTRSRWGIFPHPRVTLKSVPVMWNADPKIIMTTGTVTQPNYLAKKAGLKAEFHHVIGAVIVEIDADGDYFARHLIADKDGSFQDLTNIVLNGKVYTDKTVESITWGDTHPELLGPDVALGCWGICANYLSLVSDTTDCMLDALLPTYQFFHDALDMRRRNHHSIHDPHKRAQDFYYGTDSVEEEVCRAAHFLELTQRPWCQTLVVDSNHDRALLKWLKTADYKTDPANAVYFLKLQHAVYQNIADGNDDFLLAEYAFRETGCDIGDVRFLRNTDSFVICPNAGGGIECALHGDLGANGAKGHINSFAKMGPKANLGHTHAAAIYEGIYVAGHSCKRDMGYNRGGLTSWSPSHIVTYPNGKRTIVTMRGAKFCAS